MFAALVAKILLEGSTDCTLLIPYYMSNMSNMASANEIKGLPWQASWLDTRQASWLVFTPLNAASTRFKVPVCVIKHVTVYKRAYRLKEHATIYKLGM